MVDFHTQVHFNDEQRNSGQADPSLVADFAPYRASITGAVPDGLRLWHLPGARPRLVHRQRRLLARLLVRPDEVAAHRQEDALLLDLQPLRHEHAQEQREGY